MVDEIVEKSIRDTRRLRDPEKVSTSNFSIPANLTASPNKIVILSYFYCFRIECYFFCVFLGATGPTLDAESYSKALFAHANVCAEDISAQTRLFIYGYQRRFYMVLDGFRYLTLGMI